MWYVHILKCKDVRTYIGCTNSLTNRISRHKKGYIAATRRRLLVELFAYFVFINKGKAFEFEKYLKMGSGRAFLQKRIF